MKKSEKREGKKRVKKAIVSGLIVVFVMSLVVGLLPYDLVQPVSAASTKKAPIHINNTGGGALTHYQVNLNITHTYYMNNNFSDIRVKNETAGTFVPYWIEAKSDGNWCSLWFNATSIPASSWCNDTYYLYYGDAGASSNSNITTTFLFGDDFVYEGWDKNLGNSVEHSIIKDNTLYVPADGIYIFELDGTELHHYLSGNWGCCAPVVIGDYVYTWFYSSSGVDYLHKTKISDGSDSTVSGGNVDFEHLTTANVSGVDLIFIPKGGNVTAIRADNLSTYWTSSVVISDSIHHWDGGLVVGDYLYTRQVSADAHKVFKLNLSDGTTADSVNIEDENYYASLLYDSDHNQIIVTERNTMKIKAFDADDFSTLNWNKTLDESTGWRIMYGCSYNNNKIFIGDRTDNGHQSYLYCLNASTGVQIWKSTVAYNNNVAITNHIIDDNYIYCPTHDYFDNNYHKLMVIKISDGTLHDTISQTSDASCVCPVISDGFIYLGMWHDNQLNARKLGIGEKMDCGFKIDDYNTGYIGSRLSSYNPETPLTDKWTKYNSSDISIADSVITLTYPSAIDLWRGIKTSNTFGPYNVALRCRVQYQTAKAAQGLSNAEDFMTNADSAFFMTWGSDQYYRTVNEGTTTNILESGEFTNFHIDEALWKSGEVKFYRDGTLKATSITNIPDEALRSQIGLWSLEADNTIKADWFLVRKYAADEPTASLGTEQTTNGCDCTTPVITDLTNSTPGTTNVTITWTTNQSADNIVKYSKNSDLSPPFFASNWHNDTSSISIAISSLDSGTQYFYQAWSYNGTNSSCSITEPVSSPYKNFTTQSSGGAYNITLLSGWNILGWSDATPRTANYIATNIGSNCTYVTERNKTSGEYVTFTPLAPGENNFAIERGWGYYTRVSSDTLWERDN